MFGGLVFGGKFVLVIREAYIRGGYIRDFTICLGTKMGGSNLLGSW